MNRRRLCVHLSGPVMRSTLEALALFCLLVVAGVRPLISETYDSAGLTITASLRGVQDPQPATTWLLDSIILGAACLWLASRSTGGDTGYRRCGVEWGLGLIAVGVCLSWTVAGNKRLAINAGVDWLCSGLLGVVLTQLLTSERRVRWALSVVLATAAAQAGECFEQVWVTQPETEAMYAQEREALWAKQGVSVDSAQVALFEARMRAREATGYFGHPNVAAAHLVTCAFAALALAFSKWRGRESRQRAQSQDFRTVLGRARIGAALACGGAVIMGVACGLTGGVGALVSAGVAALVWMIGAANARRAWWTPRTAFGWGWAAVGAAGVAVAVYGLSFGSLPGRSLDFRWKYWTGAAQMIRDHPWTGVGSENFGREFLRYKTIELPEEVKNPHNFLVSAATDWGLAGVAGMIVLVFGASRRLLREPLADSTSAGAGDYPTESSPAATTRGASRSEIETALWGTAAGLGIFIPRIGWLGSEDTAFLFYRTVMPALIWAVAFLLLAPGAIRSTHRLAWGLGCALLAFLVQDTINFATLVPGTVTTAFALLAMGSASLRLNETGRVAMDASSSRHPADRWGTTMPNWGWFGATLAGFAVVVVFGALPVARAGEALRQARQASSPTEALRGCKESAHHDALDPTPPAKAAEFLRTEYLSRLGEPQPNDAHRVLLTEAIAHITEAVRRDPRNVTMHRERAQYLYLAGEWLAAVTAAEKAVELYPTDPGGHRLLGEILAGKGRAESNAGAWQRAAAEFEQALALDDARPSWETLRRLNPAERRDLAERAQNACRELERLRAGD